MLETLFLVFGGDCDRVTALHALRHATAPVVVCFAVARHLLSPLVVVAAVAIDCLLLKLHAIIQLYNYVPAIKVEDFVHMCSPQMREY